MSTNSPPGDGTSWFESLYAAARGDVAAIPWANDEPCPWVHRFVAGHPGPGRAIVVGCGLGDDAEAVAAAGYDTVAFDISPSAVGWCRERFPATLVDYRVADLFQLPDDLVGSGDLVVEVRTIQSLPPAVRGRAIDGVASLLAPGGALLLVAIHRSDHSVPTGPPWAVSDAELRRFEEIGLTVDESSVEHGQFVRVYRRP